MLTLLALSLVQPTFAPGGYSLPELCRQLSAATGVIHSPGDLRDYAVFVSVKSGDPVRIEKLVAKALRAEWFKNGQSLRLSFVKQDETEDKAIFAKQWLEATRDDEYLKLIPTNTLYDLTPGKTLRFSLDGRGVSQIPPEAIAKFAKSRNEDPTILVNKLAYFTFGSRLEINRSGSQLTPKLEFVDLTGVARPVLDALGSEIDKKVYSESDLKSALRYMDNPPKLDANWSDLSKGDLTALIVSSRMKPLSRAISKDLVMACPDGVLFSLTNRPNLLELKVQDVLKATGGSVRWVIEDGVLVGLLPARERYSKTQFNRASIEKLIKYQKANGLIDIEAHANFIATQAPSSIETWMTSEIFVLAGIGLDPNYAADYPLNIRLYSSLNKSDWALLNSGKSFSGSRLSTLAFSSLVYLLLHSRNRLDVETSDPGFWDSLSAKDLSLSAQINTEPVLVNKQDFLHPVATVDQSAIHYNDLKLKLGTEPKYRVASQTKVKLFIRHIRRSNEPVETGFARIEFVGSPNEVPYLRLSEEIRKQFEDVLNAK